MDDMSDISPQEFIARTKRIKQVFQRIHSCLLDRPDGDLWVEQNVNEVCTILDFPKDQIPWYVETIIMMVEGGFKY